MAGLLGMIPRFVVGWRHGYWVRPECRTVGDVARLLANATRTEVETITWTEEVAWLALRRAIARARGGLPSEVTYYTSIGSS